MTAAHRTLPFGTKLRVCTTRRCVLVRVNDRGPFGAGACSTSPAQPQRRSAPSTRASPA